MGNGCGLGTNWCLATALEHIEIIEAYEWHQQFYRDVFGDQTIALGVETSPVGDVNVSPKTAFTALNGLLLSLRDGYVRATGRRSATKGVVFEGDDEVWRLHASDPTLIRTDEWRSGGFDSESLALTGPSWQYVQIEVPCFMVKGIWPDWPECDAPDSAIADIATGYSTPYLDLMEEAIAYFHLSDGHQEKKDALVEWFRAHRVEGAQISGNLAGAMATLVRLPSAQKGGAKRSWAR